MTRHMTSQKYFAMDFAFFSSHGVYSFSDRCEITRAAGYDAIQTVVWDGADTARDHGLATVQQRFGLALSGVYTVLDLSLGEQDERNSGLLNLICQLPAGATLDLAIRSAGAGVGLSDPRGDARVIAWLRPALQVARDRGVEIALYTHLKFWMATHDDAIRVCEAMDTPGLGLTFSSLQWYAGDGKNLRPMLVRATPWLRRVNLSGSRRSPLGFFQTATIEPLDSGELDNFAVSALLARLGYRGYLGYNGWHEGGDPYVKLVRSLDALKDIQRRVAAHPHWAGHFDA